MRVELQNGKLLVALGQRVQVAQRGAVVAAEHHHALAGIEQRPGFFLQPLEHFGSFSRDLGRHAAELLLAGGGLAGFEPGNVFGRQRTQGAAGAGNGFVLVFHGQAQLPGFGQVRVEEVDLEGSFVDGGRPGGGAGAVAHGYFPRHGHDHHLGFGGGEGQAEEAARRVAGGVGVERGYFLGQGGVRLRHLGVRMEK